jgi:hypothetical protein
MPTPEARSIFADVQKLTDALRDLHQREHVLVEQLRYASTTGDLDALHKKIESVRSVSAELSRQHAATVDRYVAFVKDYLGNGALPVLA